MTFFDDLQLSEKNHMMRRAPYRYLVPFGAGDGAQTRDLRLGKATLYQLSYSRDWIVMRDLFINSQLLRQTNRR